jgi:hypothetical protein
MHDYVTELDRRRAIKRALLVATGPITIGAIFHDLVTSGVVADSAAERKSIADALGYLVRSGQARRVARGTYTMNPYRIPRTSLRRILEWDSDAVRFRPDGRRRRASEVPGKW